MDASTDHAALRVPRRRAIFECVGENPGAHVRDLARRSRTPLSSLVYHLDRLEHAGLVVARRDGRYKRYFPQHGFGPAQKDLLLALRLRVPRRVVSMLLTGDGATQREMASELGVSRSTVSFCVGQLVSRAIVRRESAQPETRYHLEDAGLVSRVLGSFGASLGEAGPPAVHPDAAVVVALQPAGREATSLVLGGA